VKRRRFLAALGGAALAGPIAAVAQQPAGVPRIGVLTGADPSIEAARLDAFRGALEKLGYIDGQNVVIEVRYAMGQPERFGNLARELVALAPAVIACVGGQETMALQAATRTIPIVFMQTGNPVEMGLVASLARPGGNTTGFSQMSAEVVRNGCSCCTRSRPRCRVQPFWATPTPPWISGLLTPRRRPGAWASPCGASPPRPRPR
jgi:putative ABC transport system substrate-binding protein